MFPVYSTNPSKDFSSNSAAPRKNLQLHTLPTCIIQNIATWLDQRSFEGLKMTASPFNRDLEENSQNRSLFRRQHSVCNLSAALQRNPSIASFNLPVEFPGIVRTIFIAGSLNCVYRQITGLSPELNCLFLFSTSSQKAEYRGQYLGRTSEQAVLWQPASSQVLTINTTSGQAGQCPLTINKEAENKDLVERFKFIRNRAWRFNLSPFVFNSSFYCCLPDHSVGRFTLKEKSFELSKVSQLPFEPFHFFAFSSDQEGQPPILYAEQEDEKGLAAVITCDAQLKQHRVPSTLNRGGTLTVVANSSHVFRFTKKDTLEIFRATAIGLGLIHRIKLNTSTSRRSGHERLVDVSAIVNDQFLAILHGVRSTMPLFRRFEYSKLTVLQLEKNLYPKIMFSIPFGPGSPEIKMHGGLLAYRRDCTEKKIQLIKLNAYGGSVNLRSFVVSGKFFDDIHTTDNKQVGVLFRKDDSFGDRIYDMIRYNYSPEQTQASKKQKTRK